MGNYKRLNAFNQQRILITSPWLVSKYYIASDLKDTWRRLYEKCRNEFLNGNDSGVQYKGVSIYFETNSDEDKTLVTIETVSNALLSKSINSGIVIKMHLDTHNNTTVYTLDTGFTWCDTNGKYYLGSKVEL